MKERVAQIHVENIESLVYELKELSADDISVAIKHINRDIDTITDEGREFMNHIGKKPAKPKDVILWLHYGQEKVRDALGLLQQLLDELDSLEDEINRDEINNAKG